MPAIVLPLVSTNLARGCLQIAQIAAFNDLHPYFTIIKALRVSVSKRPWDTGVCLAPPTCSVALHGVPDVAVEVVVAGQQQAAGAGERHGGDAADDVVVGVQAELLVRPQVKQPAGGVVRARGEGTAVGEELGTTGGGKRVGSLPQ